MKKVVVEKKRTIFNDFFKIDEAVVSFERFNGQLSAPRRLLLFERGDSVAAVIYHREIGKAVFVSQFRYPTYEKGPGWIMETVAGMVKEGEDPAAAIRREVSEEMGYTIENVEPIATFYVSPGGTSERILLYYAEVSGARHGGGGLPAEGEDIETLELSFAELERLLADRAIQDAKTLIGIRWLLQRHQARSGST